MEPASANHGATAPPAAVLPADPVDSDTAARVLSLSRSLAPSPVPTELNAPAATHRRTLSAGSELTDQPDPVGEQPREALGAQNLLKATFNAGFERWNDRQRRKSEEQRVINDAVVS